MAPKKRKKKKSNYYFQCYHGDERLLAEGNMNFVDEIAKRFNKKFTLKSKDRDFALPESEFLYNEEPFVISELLTLKDELNSTKSLLNDMDIEVWHQHTRRTNKAGLVVKLLREEVQAEMCTQAWAKLYEILCSYEVVSQCAKQRGELRSLHLCEAPGAFIASLNHYLKNSFPGLNWQWLASTLNPYYEGNDLNAMLDDDSFILKTLDHWDFGLDGTGDLMRLDNMKHLKQACDSKGSFDLVTADGSIDCADEPDEQEKVVGQLIFCETIAALNMLNRGGTYIFKMFTALEYHMICMVYLLCCLFDEVHVIKPGTSKSGNSEVYVSCINFIGSLPPGYQEILNKIYDCSSPSHALFSLKFIPEDFLSSLKKCQHFFIGMQVDEIRENIRHFHHMSKIERKQLYQFQSQVTLHYLNTFQVKKIEVEDRVVSGSILDGIQRDYVGVISKGEHFGNKKKSGSYNQRHLEVSQGWFESVRDDNVLTCRPSACLTLKGLCQANNGMMLIPLYPRQVEWLSQRIQNNGIFYKSITYERRLRQVRNSRFCSPIYITKLKDAIDNAWILSPAKRSDLAKIVQQFSVLSFSSSSDYNSCRFCIDSVIALDKLVAFTASEQRETPRKALVLNSQEHCQCFDIYFRSKGISVQFQSSTKVVQFDEKSIRETLGETSADIVVLAHYHNIPANSFESIHVPLELTTKQELLMSCINALKTLKQGGTFICCFYYSMTRFTAGLLYILHRMFDKMAIVKPVVGALWHPEKFLVCKNFSGYNQELVVHLEKIHKAINERESVRDLDILEVIDMAFLYEENFFSFVMRINENHAHLQLLNIIRLESFYLFPNEIPDEEERERLRQEVLNYLS